MHIQLNNIRNQLDQSSLKASIFHPDSTFNFIRKKNRNTQDNFDFIQNYYEQGKHIKVVKTLNDAVMAKFNEVKEKFPNFIEVTEHIENQLILRSIGRGNIKFEPLYLWGEPGIGKTEWVHAISSALQLPFEKLNASVLSGSFSLAGSESQWADSAPGIIAKAMIKHNVANFITYIDELDKVQERASGGNPINALFDLLEETSAKKFVDLAFGDSVFLDTTNISFIASGNDVRSIHPAILSRFTVFKVEAPSNEQIKTIINNIHQSMLRNNDWGSCFEKELRPEVVDAMLDGDNSVRNVKKNLKSAYVYAYKNGRGYLIPSDFNFNLSKPIRMGFC